MDRYLFILYEHQYTHFLAYHSDYLASHAGAQVEVLCIDRDYGASRRGFLDLFRVAFLIAMRYRNDPGIHVITITPKGGAIGALLRSLGIFKKQTHWFTGQVWATSTGVVRLLKKLPDQLTALAADRILCDSIPQREFLLENGFTWATSKMAVPAFGSICGIDDALFAEGSPWSKAFDASIVQVGIVGRVNEDKGFSWFIANFPELETSNLQFHIYGTIDGNLDFEKKFLEFVAANADLVIFHGEERNLSKIYSGIDILLNLSYREGFSNVMIESQSYGVPIIARDIYAIKTSFSIGVSGELFNDADTLNEKLSLYRDSSVRQLAGKRGYSFVESRFRRSHVLAAIYAYYTEKTFG
ncbi:glycosyltransferase [Pseudomonadales bacterium]|nr:glycosyltransferase [Pseudomonadales bacterium]